MTNVLLITIIHTTLDPKEYVYSLLPLVCKDKY